MEIVNLTVGPIETNCYIIWGTDKKAIIIDPGDEPNDILSAVQLNSLDVVFVLNTHGHWDHTGANGISKQLGAKLLIHEADEPQLPEKADGHLYDGQAINFGKNKAEIIGTPGHTEGSVSIKIDRHLFTGDTLFSGSIGRTDLPGGSTEQMLKTLAMLKEMDPGLEIYPGHGPKTSLRREVQVNPYMTNSAFLK